MYWGRNRWGHSPPLWSPSLSECHLLCSPRATHQKSLPAWGHQQHMSLEFTGEKTTTLPAEFMKFGSSEQLRICTKGVHIFRETKAWKPPPSIPFWGTNFMRINNTVVLGGFSQALSKEKESGDPLLFLHKGLNYTSSSYFRRDLGANEKECCWW